jgi:hypothetical protein
MGLPTNDERSKGKQAGKIEAAISLQTSRRLRYFHALTRLELDPVERIYRRNRNLKITQDFRRE